MYIVSFKLWTPTKTSVHLSLSCPGWRVTTKQNQRVISFKELCMTRVSLRPLQISIHVSWKKSSNERRKVNFLMSYFWTESIQIKLKTYGLRVIFTSISVQVNILCINSEITKWLILEVHFRPLSHISSFVNDKQKPTLLYPLEYLLTLWKCCIASYFGMSKCVYTSQIFAIWY